MCPTSTCNKVIFYDEEMEQTLETEAANETPRKPLILMLFWSDHLIVGVTNSGLCKTSLHDVLQSIAVFERLIRHTRLNDYLTRMQFEGNFLCFVLRSLRRIHCDKWLYPAVLRCTQACCTAHSNMSYCTNSGVPRELFTAVSSCF